MAAEPPLHVESREELVYLLAQASELEHGLMCEYLFAQFTLKRTEQEGLSAGQLAKVAAWEKVIVDVTKQEMLHLALATNLLTAIGAAPHLHRPNFPILSRWYPPGVQVALVPFGERALRHFIYLERPEGMDLDDAEGFAAMGHAQPLTDGEELMAVPEDYQTVGHLYRGIEQGFERLVERHGEAAVFIGPPEAQATTEVFEWSELTAVTDLASAAAAIELIVEQGEGARGDWRDAHFGKFVALLGDYLATREADPGFEPARPVEPAYVRRPPDVDAGVATITDPLTVQVADLFNVIYETTLQALSRYFVHSGETDRQVTTLATTAKHLMNWVMRPLGSLFTTLPLGPDRPGVLAGPAFEIVQPSFYVLPHRQAAWRILTERLDELAGRAERLSTAAGLGNLIELAADLRGMARDAESAQRSAP
ncbi:MAG TPA: ferritin-like domain-containing protein [Actinomycetota bacterium]|jgi:Ferritin-like